MDTTVLLYLKESQLNRKGIFLTLGQRCAHVSLNYDAVKRLQGVRRSFVGQESESKSVLKLLCVLSHHRGQCGCVHALACRGFSLSLSLFQIYLFLERGKWKEKEGEKHGYKRETSIGCLLHASQPGMNLQSRRGP